MAFPTLPQFQDSSQPFQLMQSAWANILNPLLANPALDSSLLTGVALTAGANTINHKLGRKLQGWQIVRLRAAATIYDTQDSNTTPTLTLTLNASAPVTVDILVF